MSWYICAADIYFWLWHWLSLWYLRRCITCIECIICTYDCCA